MARIIQWIENHVNWYGWFIGLFVLAVLNVVLFSRFTAFPLDKIITIILIAAGIFSFALLFRFSYQIIKHDIDDKHQQTMDSLQVFEQKVNHLLTTEQTRMKYNLNELSTAISRSQIEINRTIHSQINQISKEEATDLSSLESQLGGIQQQLESIQENMQKHVDDRFDQLVSQMNEKITQLEEKLINQSEELKQDNPMLEKLRDIEEGNKKLQLASLNANDQTQKYLEKKLSAQDEVMKHLQLAVLDTGDHMQEYIDGKLSEQMQLLKTFQLALLDTNDYVIELTNGKSSIDTQITQGISDIKKQLEEQIAQLDQLRGGQMSKESNQGAEAVK